MANQEFHQCRLRIDHIQSRVKRCCSVKTEATYGRWASAIGGGTSAMPSIMPGSASPRGSPWLNRD